jgi:hypothetical protein
MPRNDSLSYFFSEKLRLVRMQNQLEALLEEAHIKLSSFVSDLLGVSARRMMHAIAKGETDPAVLAAMADKNLRATSAQLADALGACTELNPGRLAYSTRSWRICSARMRMR